MVGRLLGEQGALAPPQVLLAPGVLGLVQLQQVRLGVELRPPLLLLLLL